MKESHSKLFRRGMASVVSASMVFSFMIAPAFANTAEAADVPEWAADNGQHSPALSAQASIPDQYDLRNDGLVTPVKLQNPWSSCWAFGGTAAAESSILSAYGTTYEKSKLDLSERHLAYFALHPMSADVDPDQTGEGLITIDQSNNAAFDAGGLPVYVTTLFSQGVGPVAEEAFPYRGKDAILTLDYLNAHPQEAAWEQMVRELGSEQAAEQYLANLMESQEITREQALSEIAEGLRQSAIAMPTYAAADDWSIPETNEDGSSNHLITGGLVLKDGNVLPSYWNDKVNDEAPNKDCIEAMKQELLNGRGVSIMYYADQGEYARYARSGDEGQGFAEYCYDALPLDHSVCVVGYDANYSKANFTHDVYKLKDESKGYTKDNFQTNPDGSFIVDTGKTAMTTPHGNGAWIVKNSWGSETDGDLVDDLGNAVNKGAFGIKDGNGKATGYFYLSFYDRTITSVETMDFTANLTSDGFYAIQYDYMPAVAGFFQTVPSDEITSSANVFTAEDQVELKSISTRTSEANMRVTFAVYQLNDNAANPTDGELLYRTSENFQYGGFHRLDLDQKVTFRKGQRFSIVSTASTLNQDGKRKYNVSACQGVSKEYADDKKMTAYEAAVINEGESFLYSGGEWTDWKGYVDQLNVPYEGETRKYTDLFPIDNFSIKAYAVPVSDADADKPMHRLYNPNSGEHFYTASDGERDMLVDLGWNSEGDGWTAPAKSETPVYRLYNANGGEHHYTMSVVERDALIDAGWNDEGVGWYSDDDKGVLLLREYNPNAFANNHNYTASESEHSWLLSLGWRDEGTAWYGLAST